MGEADYLTPTTSQPSHSTASNDNAHARINCWNLANNRTTLPNHNRNGEDVRTMHSAWDDMAWACRRTADLD